MKTILHILSGKTDDNVPRERFRLRLQWAVDYYQEHHLNEEIVFLVSGRCGNVNENIPLTHAEIGKRYITERVSDAHVIKEDISVDTIGNFAFSKPLIEACTPDKVIIVTSAVIQDRINYLIKKVFADEFECVYEGIDDELTDDPTLIEKEANALKLLEKLTVDVADGDDRAIRELLLYRTPYYFKGIVDDKMFFDEYWPGGFDSFLNGRRARNSK